MGGASYKLAPAEDIMGCKLQTCASGGGIMGGGWNRKSLV